MVAACSPFFYVHISLELHTVVQPAVSLNYLTLPILTHSLKKRAALYETRYTNASC